MTGATYSDLEWPLSQISRACHQTALSKSCRCQMEGSKISGVDWKSKVGCFVVAKSSRVVLVSTFKLSTLSRLPQVVLVTGGRMSRPKWVPGLGLATSDTCHPVRIFLVPHQQWWQLVPGHSIYQVGPHRCKSNQIRDTHYQISTLCRQLDHCLRSTFSRY